MSLMSKMSKFVRITA